MVLFLTAHLPEGFPRVSQLQAGSKQTLRHTFISAVFASYSLPLPPSYACMVFLLHFLQKCICSFTIPFLSHSHAAFWVNFRESLSLLTFSYKCATSVYIVLYLDPEFKGLSPQIWFSFFCFFCQASLSLRNVTPYHFSRPEEARTEQDKLQISASVGFNSGFDTRSTPMPLSK